MNRILIIIFAFGLIVLNSCKSSKPVEEKAQVQKQAVDTIFQNMQKHQIQYDWFGGKFIANSKTGDKKHNFTGQFRIRKDSVIWLSIYATMNIEIFRIMITPDSIKMLNRLEKTYFCKGVSFINQKFNTDVDFDILQSLLMGTDFAYYETNKFTLNINENRYKLSTLGRRKLKKYVKSQEDLEKVMVQNMWINPENYKITKQNIKQVKNPNKKVIAVYQDFRAVDGQLFPYDISFRLVDEKPTNLSMKYRSIIIDQELTFPFKVPKKYKKL
ncbi:MAG: hypothetical protein DRI84_08345 [Bacteroidetes bacterium]|nr:MAG: hypothetical protein DRI84_08345 [Bacteroidota bacterium]